MSIRPDSIVFSKLSKEEQEKLFIELCESVVDNNTSFKREMDVRNVSYSVFNKILIANPHLAEIYQIARIARCDYLFEEVIEIADTPIQGDEVTTEEDENGVITKTITKRSDQYRHRQIQIDARKWAVQRINPTKYGDKIDITSDNKAINQVAIFQIPDDGRNAKND